MSRLSPDSNAPSLTAVCGGIGAGKSVVSRVLRAMSYEVFDCDSEAKALMDNDYAADGYARDMELEHIYAEAEKRLK